MTNTAMLREYFEKSGYKLRFIAERIGLTYQGLLNKVENKSYFNAVEIKALCDLLAIPPDKMVSIFFN